MSEASSVAQSCRVRVQELRAKLKEHNSSDGDGDARLDNALHTFSHRLEKQAASHSIPCGGRRRPRLCSCCCRFLSWTWAIRALVFFLTLYYIWTNNPWLQQRTRIVLAKHSYHYILRPARFATVPLLRAFPGPLKRWFHVTHCMVENPWFRQDDPPPAELLSDGGEAAQRPVNCACRGIQGGDAPRHSAAAALAWQRAEDGSTPSVLLGAAAAAAIPEFAAWVRGNAAMLNQSVCMSLAYSGDDTLEYSTPGDWQARLDAAAARHPGGSGGTTRPGLFLGLTWMLCPGSAGGTEVADLVPDPALDAGAERAGLRLADTVWLSMATRGSKERHVARATPFDMSPISYDALVRVALVTGATRIRLSATNCPKCMPIELDLDVPGQSVLYNSSVWIHDQVIRNADGDLSVTVTTSYRWPEAEDVWAQDVAKYDAAYVGGDVMRGDGDVMRGDGDVTSGDGLKDGDATRA